MGRVCVVNFTSLDGLIQSPLSDDEDRAGGFNHGGWVPPHSELVTAVERLTTSVDGDIVVLGSGMLVRGLAEHDLVDENRLLIFPVVLGAGKRMFDDRARAARLRLADTTLSTSGVAIHTFVRDRNASTTQAVPPA